MVLVSWRQSTSGSCSRLQSLTCGRRTFRELTFQVANFNTAIFLSTRTIQTINISISIMHTMIPAELTQREVQVYSKALKLEMIFQPLKCTLCQRTASYRKKLNLSRAFSRNSGRIQCVIRVATVSEELYLRWLRSPCRNRPTKMTRCHKVRANYFLNYRYTFWVWPAESTCWLALNTVLILCWPCVKSKERCCIAQYLIWCTHVTKTKSLHIGFPNWKSKRSGYPTIGWEMMSNFK